MTALLEPNPQVESSHLTRPGPGQSAPFGTEDGDDSSSSSCTASNRPRSRAIAIKRRPPRHFYNYVSSFRDEHASNQSETSNEQMYDWATWRMYARIIDHRRNQQQRYRSSSNAPPMMGHGNQDPYGHLGYSYAHSVANSSAAAVASTFDNCYGYHANFYLDGEVFELDDI